MTCIYVVVTVNPLAEHFFEHADKLIEFLCDEKPSVFSVRKLWCVSAGKDHAVIQEKSLVQGGVVIERIPF